MSKNSPPTGLKNSCNSEKFAVGIKKSIVLSRMRNTVTVLGNCRAINIQEVHSGLSWSFGVFFPWK